jgi:NitT/TauT family transport system substrate-binding protein
MSTSDVTARQSRRSRAHGRAILALAAAAALGMLLGACSSSSTSPASTAKAPAMVTLDLGEVPFYANNSLALGEKVGIFKHYGINVVLQPEANVNVIFANVESGHQQLGFATIPLLLKADEAGQSLKCVAPMGPANNADRSFPQNAVMVAKGSSIKSLAQLVGKTVALNELSGSNELYLDAGVTAAGGSFADVHLTQIPFADMSAALKSGSVQAAFEVPPFISAGEQAGDQQQLSDLDSLTTPWTTECYAATTSYINSNKAVLTRFVHAESQAILYAKAHPGAANAEIGPVSGLSASAAKATIPPKIVYTNSLAPSTIIKYENFMKRYNDLPGPVLSASQVSWVAPGEPATTLLFATGGKFTG